MIVLCKNVINFLKSSLSAYVASTLSLFLKKKLFVLPGKIVLHGNITRTSISWTELGRKT